MGNLQVLLLAWKMGASRMGYFSRHEFTTGLKLLNATSLDKLRKVEYSRVTPLVFLHSVHHTCFGLLFPDRAPIWEGTMRDAR